MLLEEEYQPQQKQVFNTYGNPNLILNSRPVRLTMLDDLNNKKKGLSFDLNDVMVCKGYESDYLIEEEELSEDEGGYFDDVYEPFPEEGEGLDAMDYTYPERGSGSGLVPALDFNSLDYEFSSDFQNLSFHEMYEPQPIAGLVTPDLDVKLVENDHLLDFDGYNTIDNFHFNQYEKKDQQDEDEANYNSRPFNQFFNQEFDNNTPQSNDSSTSNQFFHGFDNSVSENDSANITNDSSSFSNTSYSLFNNDNDNDDNTTTTNSSSNANYMYHEGTRNVDYLPRSPKSIKQEEFSDDDMMIDDNYQEKDSLHDHNKNHHQQQHQKMHHHHDKLDHLCQLINPSTGKSCNKQFSRPYDLIRHQETIHATKKKIFRCIICEGRFNGGKGNGKSKTFSRNDALSRHIKVKHGLAGDDALKLINDAKENVEYIEQ